MSDLTLIAEDILDTMHALDEACHAAKALDKAYRAPQVEGESQQVIETLHEDAEIATFDLFRGKMMELYDRLSKLKVVLDNEEAYAVDELVDALSMAYTGHRAEYRRTPRMHE
jgi:hypothetical protein